MLQTNFTKFLSKKVAASRYSPWCHKKSSQIQRLGIHVYVFVAIAAKYPFYHWSNPPPPCQVLSVFHWPPSPWRHLWKPPYCNCKKGKNDFEKSMTTLVPQPLKDYYDLSSPKDKVTPTTKKIKCTLYYLPVLFIAFWWQITSTVTLHNFGQVT